MKKFKNQKGFTLVELMVVLVIIGILATMAIPKFLGSSQKAKASEFKPILKQIYTLQTAYFMEKDAFSASKADLGFVDPTGSDVRFTYAVSTTTTKLGQATPTSSGATGMGIATTDQGCVNDQGSLTADSALAALANVSSSACN